MRLGWHAQGAIRMLVPMFLSDIVEELDAARQAGMQMVGLAREGGELPGHMTRDSFAGIDLASL